MVEMAKVGLIAEEGEAGFGAVDVQRAQEMLIGILLEDREHPEKKAFQVTKSSLAIMLDFQS